MPIGVITVSLAVAVGGLLGMLLRSKFSENLKEMLNLIFGLCAMSMGVASVVLMKNMPAVVLSIIVGTVLGTVMLRVLASGLSLMGIPATWQKALIGVVIVTIIVLDVANEQRKNIKGLRRVYGHVTEN